MGCSMVGEQTTYSAVLGVVLSNLRQEIGLDQKLMADRMGLSQASYSRLEGGKSAFSVDQVYQAGEALGLDGQQITMRLNNTVSSLRSNGIQVVPQIRGNTTQAKQEPSAGVIIAGAALGALLIGLLSKK